MNRLISVFIVSVFISLNPAGAENWNQWRGPRRDGTSFETNVPVRWSPTKNIVWKTPLPGKGHASPIVWDDRIFTVTALKEKQQRVLLCLDRSSGKILWQRIVLSAPTERIHRLNSYASSTPITDGQRVYVSFLDRDKMFEKLILNGDHDGPGYLVALDRNNGRTIWKNRRPNDTRSYCPPIIRTIDGRNQLILSGSLCVASYDPDNGKQHWISDGPTEQYVASLVYNGDLLFMTCGYPQRFLQGIRPDGSGNVTKTHVTWTNRNNSDCAYVPSPIAFGDYFIVVSDKGVVSCLRAKTGKLLWKEKLAGGHSASLISANGLVYFLSDDGVTNVIRPGETFELVARNELGEETYASPALSNGKIYIRALKHLFAIGK